jgi:hypothetical protein
MTKQFFIIGLLVMGMMQSSSALAGDAKDMETLQIGGVGNVRFMDATHGYASSGAGTWAALSFEVTSTVPQADGSVLAEMYHDFVTPVGGWVKTKDEVLMQPIPGRPGVFSLQVTYNIYEAGNGMEGFEGQQFHSNGFIDTNPDRRIASVRYEGYIKRPIMKSK